MRSVRAGGAVREARGPSGREGSEARSRREIELFRPQEFPLFMEKLRILCQIWKIIFRVPFGISVHSKIPTRNKLPRKLP